VRQPILTDADLEKIRFDLQRRGHPFKSRTLAPPSMPASRGGDGAGSTKLCARAKARVREGVNIIILSTAWRLGPDPIPRCSPGAAGIIIDPHRIANLVGLVVGIRRAARSASFACLAAYGAEAINPYWRSRPSSMNGPSAGRARRLRDRQALHQSIGKGLLKVMSKMASRPISPYSARDF